MMWAVVLGLGRATKCPDGSVHWLQPNLQGVDSGLLSNHDAQDAWCYPTAAASLLGKLANSGQWNSKMKDDDKYPTDSTYTSGRSDPWMDYSWHEMGALDLGYYMKTNNPTAGTTLENGKKGIEDFIDYADSSKEALVTIHSGYPDTTEIYPLLLHIDTACISLNVDDDNKTKLDIGNGGNSETTNNNPINLGHTVVAYKASTGASGIQLEYEVAMNLVTVANPDGEQCTPTIIQLQTVQNQCIKGYTTVQLQDKETDTKEEFPLGAIIGIAVGGTVLLAFVGYKIYRWQFPPNPRVLSPVANQNSLIF